MMRWVLTVAMLVLAALGATGAPAAERRKIIIDQDAFEGPGLQPILMLLNDPAIDVLGITIVSGDGWQPEETAATLRMLELVKRTDIPVIAGATFPLVNSKARNARREALYGALPYKGAWMDSWPAYNTIKRREPHAPDVVAPMAEGMPTTKPLPVSAAEFLLAMSRKYPGQVTILAMGPLTNLALAQRLDDGFAGRIREIVTEGGNFVGRDLAKAQDEFAMQVAFNPRMSFNHFWDPEAAHIVFTSPWPKLTLVTGDASDPTVGTQALLDRATASGRPVAAYVKRIAQPGYPLWDETQAAAWRDPAIVTARGRLAMDVDLMPGANYGALLTWPAGKGPGLGERDVDLIYAVDVPKVEAMFVDLVGR
ncbi:nucleoside hydrolase [Sphingomonas sp. BIUV-7]|uniref:Nucleoside hydrolase n=1 Tax=Sphingomonas natans TaxID=3063330 RepID=A0ABT8YGC6_9SPHN|nr:nucleoside hydrolase [Sphingomonas sp. BIUV-7]MDO6416925.1 nucleoside hydrolase [Sphingomonas sp. BIUV-7]